MIWQIGRRKVIISKEMATACAYFFLSSVGIVANGQTPFAIQDVGTLGGNQTVPGVPATSRSANAFGMVVGSSKTQDNTDHAFLWVNGQILDLNTLCDLSTTDFAILTAATTITDSCLIVGQGTTANGETHTFLLTPIDVAGGQWSYDGSKWIWKQPDGGWGWESDCHCYKWHGPVGKHAPPPKDPPDCWLAPLPCPVDASAAPGLPAGGNQQGPSTTTQPNAPSQSTGSYPFPSGGGYRPPSGGGYHYPAPNTRNYPYPPSGPNYPPPGAPQLPKPNQPAPQGPEAPKGNTAPDGTCWCCVNGKVTKTSSGQCAMVGGTCYPTKGEADQACAKTRIRFACDNGKVISISAELCDVKKLQCFDTQAEAAAQCAPKSGQSDGKFHLPIPTKLIPLYCCISDASGSNSSVSIVYSSSECAQKGGEVFTTQAAASERCTTGFCCVESATLHTDGTVTHSKNITGIFTKRACEIQGGRLIMANSRAAAEQSCNTQSLAAPHSTPLAKIPKATPAPSPSPRKFPSPKSSWTPPTNTTGNGRRRGHPPTPTPTLTPANRHSPGGNPPNLPDKRKPHPIPMETPPKTKHALPKGTPTPSPRF